MGWQCFVIEPTDRGRRYLRRHAGWDGEHLHQAMTRIEDGPLVFAESGGYHVGGDDWSHDDPRWPAQCDCGYQFKEDDSWQLFHETIYVDAGGQEYTLRDAPIGAMWRCPWFEDGPAWAGPDGQCWAVMLPPGRDVGNEWLIDGPSSGGGFWQRTGTAPNITARPSILTPRYHGWLDGGVLSDDLEGRCYEGRQS